MLQNLAVGIVRILAPDGRTAGTGFIVHESGLIATCAHVVWPRPMRERGYPRPDSVRVVFHASGEERTARVVQEWWRDPDAEDVAILQLEGPLPEGAKPLPLGSSRHSRGHDFFSWGYRLVETFPEGLAAEGRIQARVRYGARDTLQLLTSQIDAGMSGAPLWDVQGRRVVGMVNAFWETRRHQDAWLALAIPAETLRAVCPLLSLSDLCPYRGLEPFTEADAEFFFGRARAAESLVERLQREPRFLAVLGPSGSGKSSLVQAGLIPRLRRGAVPGSDRWAFILTRPARNPLGELEARGLEGASQGLVKAVQNWLNRHPEAERLALVVDQFEELLVDAPETARRDFVAGLAALLDSPLPVTVILVMRDDFYSRFVREAGPLVRWLERGLANVPLGLEREDLRAIVEEPARAVGLALEEGLTEVIVRDAMEAAPQGTPGTVLPLLEFALTQLWERREEGMLTHDAYRRVGGVTGGLTRWADGVFSGLSEEDQRLARRVLTDLVHLGDESQGIPDSRRRRTLEELSRSEGEREAVHGLVRRLADARLLVTGRDAAGRETAELIHDALLREWGRFQEWLREDRRFLAWRQALEGRVEEWRERGQDPDLLLRGALLTEALDWLSRREEDIAPAAREFIRRSQERAEAERQARERLRQRITFGLAVGLVVTLILASLALWQWRQADEQRKVALAHQLAVIGQLEFDRTPSGPFIATAMGVESLCQRPAIEGDQLVRKGLNLLPRLVNRIAHNSTVYSVAFSPDGRLMVSGNADGTVQVWDIQAGQEVAHMDHDGAVLSVAFSTDGRSIVSGGWDNTVRVWEIATSREIARMVHDDLVTSVALSPDGELVVSGSKDGTLRIWRIHKNQEVARINYVWMVNSVAFSSDGHWIVNGNEDGMVWIRETQTGREVIRMANGSSVNSVAFSPDGKWVVSGGRDGIVRVWEVQTGREVARMLHDNGVNAVAFSPDGRWIVSGSGDRTVRVWEAQTGREVARMVHNGRVNSVAFSPNGRWVVSGGWDGLVRIWEAQAGQEIVRMVYGQAVSSLALSPDSQWVAIGGWDGDIRVHETMTGREIARMSHDFVVISLAFSPDGRWVASGSGDGTARVWETRTGKEVARIVHNGFVWSVDFSPDGRWVVSGGGDGIVRVWEAQTGREFSQKKHDWVVESVTFSPDGQQVASGSWDNTARVWETWGGHEIARIVHNDWVTSIAFSPNGRFVVSGSRDNTARVWEARTGQEIACVTHDNWLTSATFSPDGRWIASGSWDNTVRVWEAFTGNEIARIIHDGVVTSVAFSPDGQWVVSGSRDNTIRVAKVQAGQEVARMVHSGWVTSALFSPDGRWVVSGSADGTVRVWPWRAEDLIAEACRRLPRNLTREEWARYVGPEIPYHPTCPNLPVPGD